MVTARFAFPSLNLDRADERAFLVACLSNLCLQIGWALFVTLSVYLQAIGASAVQIGAAVATSGLASVAATPFAARLNERFGPCRLMCLGGLCAAFGSLILATGPHLSCWTYFGRALQGAGFAAYQNAALTLLAAVLPADRRARGLGLFGLGTNAALALGAAFAEWLLGMTRAYRAVFALGAGAVATGALLAAGLRRRPVQTSVTRVTWPLSRLLPLRRLAFVALLQGGGIATLFTFVPTHATAAGVSFTPFFTAYTVALVGLRVLGGPILDKPARHRVLALSLSLMACASLLIARPVAVRHLLLGGALFGLGQALLYPVLSAALVDRTRADDRPGAFALLSLAFSSGWMLFATISGFIASRWGYATTFLTLALSLAAGAGSMLATRDSSRGTLARLHGRPDEPAGDRSIA